MFSAIRIIIHQPVNDRLLEDFFIKKLLENNVDVKFLNLTRLYHAELITKEQKSYHIVEDIDCLNQLDSAIKRCNINKTLFIPYFIYEYKVLGVYRLLTKNSCITAFMGRGMIASPNTNKSYLEIFYKHLYRVFDYAFYERAFKKIYITYLKKHKRINSFDYIFNAGTLGHHTCGTSFEIEHVKEKISFNSVDYSRYLRSLTLNNPVKISGSYAVFLDEYLPYHPDVLMMGLKSIEPSVYFNELNSFFDSIEKEYNIQIIIAAHPKSNYEKNPYRNRLIFKDQTEILIRDSTFVIDHFSTAISYAILNEKPILVLTTNQIKKAFPELVAYTNHVSRLLKLQLINIDEGYDFCFPLTIDKKAYQEYKYNYLTEPAAENSLDEDIFWNFISRGKGL